MAGEVRGMDEEDRNIIMTVSYDPRCNTSHISLPDYIAQTTLKAPNCNDRTRTILTILLLLPVPQLALCVCPQAMCALSRGSIGVVMGLPLLPPTPPDTISGGAAAEVEESENVLALTRNDAPLELIQRFEKLRVALDEVL